MTLPPSPAIHHVMVAIPPGGEMDAIGFYGDYLGLTRLPKPAMLAGRGGVWFAAGPIELHLGIDPHFVPARKAHVALIVDDLTAIERRLAKAGFSMVEDSLLPGFERCYCDDPFGNRVELLTPRTNQGAIT